jgi:hypothetical protein
MKTYSRASLSASQKPMDASHTETTASSWKPLYRVAASARAFLAELFIEQTPSERTVRMCCLTALWKSLQPDGRERTKLAQEHFRGRPHHEPRGMDEFSLITCAASAAPARSPARHRPTRAVWIALLPILLRRYSLHMRWIRSPGSATISIIRPFPTLLCLISYTILNNYAKYIYSISSKHVVLRSRGESHPILRHPSPHISYSQ